MKLSKSQWRFIGKQAGWLKQADIDQQQAADAYAMHYDQLFDMIKDQHMSPEEASAKIMGIRTTSRWEICSHCHGEGTKDNPNLHSVSGPSIEEMMAEDDSFAESYHSGELDVPCEKCQNGKVRIHEPIFDGVSAQARQEYEMLLQEWYKGQSEQAAEKSMRARGVEF